MTRSLKSAALLGTSALVTALAVAPANAQTDSTVAAGAVGNQASGEIVVTAQRRNERAQDVPIAITAFSPERLQQQGITQAQNLQAIVPSLVVGTNGVASREGQSFTIRGQGTTYQAAPGVVVYLNEVPLPSAISTPQQGGAGNFVDLESVQVLNGPQGTLFGRNTTGGAVLLVPKKPTNTFEGYVQGKFGNYNNKELEGAINLPIVDEKVLLRIAGAYQDRDGYTHDVIWNTDRDDMHWYSGRIGLTLKPTENFENYTMAYGSNSRNNGTGMVNTHLNIAGLAGAELFGLPFCVPGPSIPGFAISCDVYSAAVAESAARGPRQTAHGMNTFQRTETWGISNTSTLNLSDALTLRNIISYQRFKTTYGADSDGTIFQFDDGDPREYPAPGVVTLPGDGTPVTYSNASSTRLPRDHLKVFTEELQLQGDLFNRQLTFTAGAFYYDQSPAGPQGAGATGFCPGAFTGDPLVCGPYDIRYAITNNSKALYAQATLDLGLLAPALHNLKLTGGYRYTWDRVSGSANLYQAFPPFGYFCFADNTLAEDASGCAFNANLKTQEPTWNIGLDYRVAPELLLYGKVSRGYKAGGINANAVFTTTRTFLPEFVTSYEAGFKSDLRLGGMPLRLNAAYYYLNYKDIQRATGDFNPDTGAAGARILSADARIQGIEAEASFRPFPGVEIGGTFSYTDAKYKRYQFVPSGTVAADCTGNPVSAPNSADLSCIPFQYVSPYTYSVHVSAEQMLGNNLGTLALFAAYSHSSGQHTAGTSLPSAQPGELLEPYGTLNVSVDWRNIAGSGLDVGFYGTNITNKLYRVSNSNTYTGQFFIATLYGEPAMYGVRLRYKFGG